MKNTFFLSTVCAVMFLFSSCTAFLEENPVSELLAEDFFQSGEMIRNSVNNLYRNGPNSWTSPGVYAGSHLMMGGWSSGLFDNLNYKGQEFFIEYAQKFEMTPNNVAVKMSTLWNDPFIFISRANNIIVTLPDIDLNVAVGLTEALRAQYLAEARFFRAYNYLYLARHFGDLPFMVTPSKNATDEEVHVPRVPVKRIYDEIIIPDLENAVSVLAVDAQYNNSGRISAIVASAVLIDAYVQMAGHPVQDASKWALAAAEAKKFLPGGAYASHHSLLVNENFTELSAYNLLRSVGVRAASPGGRRLTTCPEFIYVHEFTSGLSNAGFSQNAWTTTVNGLGSAECLPLTNNAYKPQPRFLAMYDETSDLRKRDRQFFADYFDKKDGSIVPNEPDNTPTPYFYYDWGAVKDNNSSGRHFALYRLPEMYLFAAEAIARTSEGVSAQAIDALATIRARAYVLGAFPGLTKEELDAVSADEIAAALPGVKANIVTQLTGLSPDAFVREVWLERYRELVFEYKDWNMIQRTRLYPKTNPMDSSIPVGTAEFVDITTVGTDFSQGKNFSVNNLLWPIPEIQIQRNPLLLPNNPGY